MTGKLSLFLIDFGKVVEKQCAFHMLKSQLLWVRELKQDIQIVIAKPSDAIPTTIKPTVMIN